MTDLAELAALVNFDDDPDIRAAVKALILSSLHAAQSLIDDAIPSIKMQLIKSLLPVLVKSMHQSEGEDLGELVAAVAGIYSQIREKIGAVPPVIELPSG